MAAMRSLSVLESDVRSCQAAARARSATAHSRTEPSIDLVQKEHVATANLKTVLERRKELGNLWGSNLEDIKGDLEIAKVEKLLQPLSKYLDVTALPSASLQI